MSGHSKWSTIKRKKGINDQKRGLIFSKLSRIITLAVKEGGNIADPEKNVKLRLAVSRARAENMPKENILRAIEKGKGDMAQNVREAVYEGFGPGGTSLIITAATDNSNRTVSEIRSILEKKGGKMASSGAASYLFEKCGVVTFKKEEDEDAVFALADKLGSVDIETNDEEYVVYIPFDSIGAAHEGAGTLTPDRIELYYKPKTTVVVDQETGERMEHLIEELEDHPDVDEVFTNASFREERAL